MAAQEDLARAKSHIRFLYGMQVMFAALCCGGFYAGFTEINSLRAEMQREIARLQPVEFGGFETDARASVYDAKERVSVDDEDNDLGGEQLLRVRRQATGHSMHGNGDGSGSGGAPAGPEDWMWLTSYSRVPVSPLFIVFLCCIANYSPTPRYPTPLFCCHFVKCSSYTWLCARLW